MQRPHTEDLALARGVVSGSADSWARLVRGYTGLIISVIQRYLYNEDEDEQRNVYVRVLEDLYTRRLAEYDGRSSLATWVVTITRSRSLDFLRARYGRRSAPKWLDGASENDKIVYRRHYLEGLSIPEIVRRFAAEGRSLDESDVEECLHRLGGRMTRQHRTRLAHDLHVRNGGSPLDALSDELRRAFELQAERDSPEYLFFLAEQQHKLTRLRAYVEELGPRERDVVDLYFHEGLSARETSQRLGLAGQRETYTILSRVFRRLRRKFENDAPEGGT